MNASAKLLEQMYTSMYRIRMVEEEVAAVYPSDKIKSPVHLSIGQESVSVAVCEALKPSDAVFGTYRGHALYLAKGGDLNGMIAELYGKQTGCTCGKGGSMHLADGANGVMGMSAVVATTIPEAIGYAYAVKHLKKDSVVVCFFGDGATEEGVFSESINFAALKKLPILFVCENNLYAIHTHISVRQANQNISERVAAFGVPAERLDNDNVLNVYETAQRMVDEIRSGVSGPRFLEVMTYRMKEHVGPGHDFDLGFRTRDEAEPWVQGDQVKELAEKISPEARKAIEEKVDKEIAEAFAFAESSPFPDPDELTTHVYKD